MSVQKIKNNVVFGNDITVSGNISVLGTVDGRDVSADGTNQDNHIADVANPHTVTKTQIGLSNVTGDVVGPASSVDNAIARYNLATGKLIQNSGVTIDDSNTMSGVVDIVSTGQLQSGAGTAGVPTYSFSSDTDTGRWLVELVARASWKLLLEIGCKLHRVSQTMKLWLMLMMC